MIVCVHIHGSGSPKVFVEKSLSPAAGPLYQPSLPHPGTPSPAPKTTQAPGIPNVDSLAPAQALVRRHYETLSKTHRSRFLDNVAAASSPFNRLLVRWKRLFLGGCP